MREDQLLLLMSPGLLMRIDPQPRQSHHCCDSSPSCIVLSRGFVTVEHSNCNYVEVEKFMEEERGK